MSTNDTNTNDTNTNDEFGVIPAPTPFRGEVYVAEIDAILARLESDIRRPHGLMSHEIDRVLKAIDRLKAARDSVLGCIWI